MVFTGFEPFGGMSHNPSIAAARAAAAAWGDDARFAVLPVDWKRTIPALRIACAPGAARVVAFGLAASRSAVCVERTAYNEVEGRADNAGFVSSGALVEGGAPARVSGTATLRLVERLAAHLHLPVELSDDAGRYLCNAVLYEALDVDGVAGGEALFVHIPPCDDATAEEIGRAVVTVLRAGSTS